MTEAENVEGNVKKMIEKNVGTWNPSEVKIERSFKPCMSSRARRKKEQLSEIKCLIAKETNAAPSEKDKHTSQCAHAEEDALSEM